jgi:radical SAM-linked protein
LRFGFSKTGSLAWISHLDTLRLLDRALRRSGLPVSFSGGFHPMPRLQIALPLPLGVEGFGEWLDLDCWEPLEADQARQLLQRELPEELRLLSAVAVPLAGPSLSQELSSARWRFALRPEGPGDPALAGGEAEWPDAQEWEAALSELRSRESWIWHDRDKKGRPRQRECRPALRQVSLSRHDRAEAWVEVQLETSIDGQGFGLRPEHLRGWLSEQLRRPLRLGAMRREGLQLRPC